MYICSLHNWSSLLSPCPSCCLHSIAPASDTILQSPSPVQGVEAWENWVDKEAKRYVNRIWADQTELSKERNTTVEHFKNIAEIVKSYWQQSQSNAGEQDALWDEVQTLVFNAGSGQHLRNGTKELLKQKYSITKSGNAG